MEKVILDKDLCIACGSCVAICPNHFNFGDDDLAEVTNDEVNDDVRDAMEACPTEAITIEESEEDK